MEQIDLVKQADKKFIACNYAVSTKTSPKGGLAYVVHFWPLGKDSRLRVVSRSHSGRWIEIWEPLKKLTNFRVKTIPPEHPRYQDRRLIDYGEEACEKMIRMIHGNRLE